MIKCIKEYHQAILSPTDRRNIWTGHSIPASPMMRYNNQILRGIVDVVDSCLQDLYNKEWTNCSMDEWTDRGDYSKMMTDWLKNMRLDQASKLSMIELHNHRLREEYRIECKRLHLCSACQRIWRNGQNNRCCNRTNRRETTKHAMLGMKLLKRRRNALDNND